MAPHVALLASDAFAGRDPAAPEARLTIDYIARAFARAGLKPVGSRGFEQPVPMAQVRGVAASVRVGLNVAGGRDVLVGPFHAATAIEVTGPVVPVVGDSLPPRANGALLVVTLDPTKGSLGDALFGAVRGAWAAGAAGVIALTDATPGSDAWTALAERMAVPRTMLDDGRGIAVVAVSRAAERRLFPVRTATAPEGAIALETTAARFQSANVVGRVAGRGRRAAEHVIFTAHWDHLGRCAPGEADAICNGAVDNASGVAGLIELARAFARGPRPGRSILFVATTGEEAGLLGARWYVDHPAVPLAATVGGLNLDTIAAGPPDAPVSILGEGLTGFDPLIAAAAAAQGRVVVTNPAVQPFLQRSDTSAFVGAGVPLLAATSIFGAPGAPAGVFADFMRERYHKPGDSWSAAVDLTGAARDVDLAYRFGRALADASKRPGWMTPPPMPTP